MSGRNSFNSNSVVSTSRPGSPWIHVDLDNGTATAVTTEAEMQQPALEFQQKLGRNRPGTVVSTFQRFEDVDVACLRAILCLQPPCRTGPLLPSYVQVPRSATRNRQITFVSRFTFFENPDPGAVVAML